MKKFAFYFITIVGLFIFAIIVDYSAGFFHEASFFRKSSSIFQGEVAPLHTTTNHLLPNLHDHFPDEHHPSGKRLVRTDQFGILQGPDTGISENQTRVLFLGGSTTENNEVHEEFRFPYLAISQLNKITGSNFIGVNAGVRAHTTQNSINLYLNHPSPDIEAAQYVVMMHNINDRLKLTLDKSYKSTLNTHSQSSLEATVGALKSSAYSLFQWARSKSNLIYLLDSSISGLFISDNGIIVNERILDKVANISETDVGKFQENLKIFADIVKAKGKVPILMTQPLGKDSKGQDIFNDSIRKIAFQNKISLIDLDLESKKITEKDRLFLSDGIHFNDNGSKWASDFITAELASILKIKSSKSMLLDACKPINSNGQNIVNQPLNRNLLEGRYPSLSSDGKNMLYQAYQDGRTLIKVLELKSGKSSVLLEKAGINTIEHPTWLSPSQIIYGEKSEGHSLLYVFDLKTKVSDLLIPNSNLSGAIASVSNLGEIAFAGYELGPNQPPIPEIYYMKSFSSPPIKITSTGFEKWRPFFNESEKSIFFIGSPDRNNFNLYKVGIASKSMSLVYSDQAKNHWDPAISPNGKMIAFAQKNKFDFDLFISQLPVNSEYLIRYASTAEDEWDPRFSPDGRYLLYAGSSIFGSQIRAICLK